MYKLGLLLILLHIVCSQTKGNSLKIYYIHSETPDTSVKENVCNKKMNIGFAANIGRAKVIEESYYDINPHFMSDFILRLETPHRRFYFAANIGLTRYETQVKGSVETFGDYDGYWPYYSKVSKGYHFDYSELTTDLIYTGRLFYSLTNPSRSVKCSFGVGYGIQQYLFHKTRINTKIYYSHYEGANAGPAPEFDPQPYNTSVYSEEEYFSESRNRDISKTAIFELLINTKFRISKSTGVALEIGTRILRDPQPYFLNSNAIQWMKYSGLCIYHSL
jgi:hypothetical protein